MGSLAGCNEVEAITGVPSEPPWTRRITNRGHTELSETLRFTESYINI